MAASVLRLPPQHEQRTRSTPKGARLHGTDILASRSAGVVRARKCQHAVDKFWPPEIGSKPAHAGLVRVVEAMESQAVIERAIVVVISEAFSEDTCRDVALAVPRTQENILATATFKAALGNREVFASTRSPASAVVMRIPLEVRADLVFDTGPIGNIGRIFGAGVTGQVGVDGQRIAPGACIRAASCLAFACEYGAGCEPYRHTK